MAFSTGADSGDPNELICRNIREVGSRLNRNRICKTRDWNAVCSNPAVFRGTDPPPMATSAQPASSAPSVSAQPAPPAPASARVDPDIEVLSPPVEPFWRVMGVFRNESAVDSLNGYNFEPAELRRLFRAGAEQGRLRCLDIARLLGVHPAGAGTASTLDPAMEAKLVRWCSPELPRNEALCGAIEHPEGFRSCDDPAPPALDACGAPPASATCQVKP